MLSERARERNDSRSLSVVRERESLLHGNTNTLATAARPYCFWESLRESKVTARFIQVLVCVCVCVWCQCNCFFSGHIANWLLLLLLALAVAASAGFVALRFLCFSLLFALPHLIFCLRCRQRCLWGHKGSLPAPQVQAHTHMPEHTSIYSGTFVILSNANFYNTFLLSCFWNIHVELVLLSCLLFDYQSELRTFLLAKMKKFFILLFSN